MASESESDKEQTAEGDEPTLSAAQRARAERSRQRARALRSARLLRREGAEPPAVAAPDCGGGFLPAPEPPPRAAAPAPAPLVHRSVQPACLQCAARFPQSFLLDTFDYSVCDACRDDAGAHALLPRTQAKSEFLLQDCDLDARPPPLRALSRPNPHRARAPPMRLYLRAQLEERACAVWGGRDGLQRERAARAERRERAEHKAAGRRLRALRLAARSGLFAGAREGHEHAFGPETYDADADEYRRECACGHRETYEKM
ncbi:DNA repair protein complementing XP-A cells homolog [Bicyclus anynana]|uniref:DNA repair protein complementing XP-A cells homolog n=1 Tax=Bicyclus anynana TaxID=110368 RepID=A0ABM3LLF5_BICAN|nr:DNA repair protein complementing XP-A cells homolog [Bicyclus anynana]XP_052739908.1 DNA repair protein complementing XP-A cells homolog [Bicyclus anynana]